MTDDVAKMADAAATMSQASPPSGGKIERPTPTSERTIVLIVVMVFVWLASFAAPAFAAPASMYNAGAAIAQGNSSTGSQSSLAVNTVTSVPAGTLLIAVVTSHANNITGCSDPVNGTYANVGGAGGNTRAFERVYYVYTAANTPTGTTITCTEGSASFIGVSVSGVTGADPVNPIETASIVTGTAVSTTAGVSLGSITNTTAGDIFFYGLTAENPNIFATEDPTFVNGTNGNSQQIYHTGYQLTTTVGAINPKPTFYVNGYNLGWTLFAIHTAQPYVQKTFAALKYAGKGQYFIKCPWPIDGGCASPNTYVLSQSGAQLQAGYIYSSTNPLQFAYDSAGTKQLPLAATPTSWQTQIRNQHLHQDGMNKPWVDYPIGSALPQYLLPMDQYVSSAGGICNFQLTGTFIGGPGIVCKPPASGTATVNELIQGIDMSRMTAIFNGTISGATLTVTSVAQGTIAAGEALSDNTGHTGVTVTGRLSGTGRNGTYSVSGSGISTCAPCTTQEPTGTETGEITVSSASNSVNPNVYLTINNVYGCACTDFAHQSGNAYSLIYGAPNGSDLVPIYSISVHNVTFDGQCGLDTQAGGCAVGGQQGAGWKAIYDRRQGATNTAVSPIGAPLPLSIDRSLFYDLGADVQTGDGSNGSVSITNSVAAGSCVSAFCHGEWFESPTSGKANFTILQTNYINSIYYQPASALNLDLTAPFYGPGANNGVTYASLTAQHNLQIINGINCGGARDPTKRPTFGYTAAYPCTAGATGVSRTGSAFLTTGGIVEIQNADLRWNMIDGSGAYYCTTNSPTVVNVVNFNGTTMNIPSGQTDAGVGYGIGYFPGITLYDPTGTLGFTPTKVLSYGTNSNGLTTSNYASISGTVVAGANCGVSCPNAVYFNSSGVYSPLPCDSSCYQQTYTSPVSVCLQAGANVLPFAGSTAGTVNSGQSTCGTTWTLTRIGGPNPTSGLFLSANSTSGCVPGQNPMCGNYVLANSEPTLTNTSAIFEITTIDSIVSSDGVGNWLNWSIGEAWSSGDPGARPYNMQDLLSPSAHTCT